MSPLATDQHFLVRNSLSFKHVDNSVKLSQFGWVSATRDTQQSPRGMSSVCLTRPPPRTPPYTDFVALYVFLRHLIYSLRSS